MVKTLLHPLWLTRAIVVPQLELAQVHYPVACGFCVCLVLFIFFSCPFFRSLSFSLLILSDRLFICPEVAVVVVMGLQDVQSQIMCRRKKFLYSNYNEEQWGFEEASGAQLSRKKEKKNIPSSTTSPIQVVKFCSSASSSLVICLQVPRYICYLIKTARKKQKERKSPHHFPGWRFSTGIGMANFGFRDWVVIKLALPFLS